jgi:hypothetical protein
MMAQPVKQTAASPLKIEKGLHEYNQQIKELSQIAWQIAYTALWNTMEFSAQEKENALSFISNFLQQGGNHKKAFSGFVQRAVLARQYVNMRPGEHIPLPSKWFSGNNKTSFAATNKWYVAIEQTRTSLPLYKQSLKAFPEAILETSQSGRAADFHYWRAYFIQQNAQGLLNLYLSVLANAVLGQNTKSW